MHPISTMLRVGATVLATLATLAVLAPLTGRLGAQAPPASDATAANAILDRMSAHEQQLFHYLQEVHPRVETYMQNVRSDATLGDVPLADRYYLGSLDYHGAFRTDSFLPQPRQPWRQWIGPLDDALVLPARHLLGLDVFRNSFAGMLFPGGEHFDRQHYQFSYVRREFLGQVRCYVFDVVPLRTGDKGSFWGRIWIEDQADVLVRFNGSFWQDRIGHPDLHFDCWRWNVHDAVWVPTYIYAEESDLHYGMFRKVRYQAQTRLWGYDLRAAGHQQELTTMSVEGAGLAVATPPPDTLSPLLSTREWERQAEDNVLDRLERAGLLAPAGPADQVLDTVVHNLEITNHLSISPPVRCRILLTTPLESVAIGHTIVLSRGLVDSLPSEAALAAMLAHELAHIDLGQRLDTRYAFADRLLFADQESFDLIHVQRTPLEEAQANTLAVTFLKSSPYKDQMAAIGLFLRQVDARRQLSPHLFSPHLGNAWFSHDFLTRLQTIEAGAPPLAPAQVTQVAALPLGSWLLVNPWDGSVKLQPPVAVPLLSAREKMPLQLTPFYPYLERASSAAAKSSAPTPPSGGGGH